MHQSILNPFPFPPATSRHLRNLSVPRVGHQKIRIIIHFWETAHAYFGSVSSHPTEAALRLTFTNYPEDCQLVTGIQLFLFSLKTAVLSPLLKKANLDHEVLANYRPISNLKVISKIIEKSQQYVFKNIQKLTS